MIELRKLQEPIAVLGAGGQVGSALVSLLGAKAQGFARDKADLEKPDQVLKALEAMNPAAVINAAAYTQVDKAEEEEQRAWLINGETPGAIARFCASRDIPFIHYSTDYVFNGQGENRWIETDEVGPLSSYGRSKLEGEEQIQAAGGKFLIFRTSWVYDSKGKNFLNTMLKLGRDRETLKIVSDQHGAPTYAPELAAASLQALDHALAAKPFPSGIFHLCHGGETTWHEFAKTIFEIARKKGMTLKIRDLEAIPTSAYPTPAKRPLNSRMDTSKAWKILNVSMPDWKTGLQHCMEEFK